MAPPNPPDEQLLTPREVAAVFGVRTKTIARWAREGRLTPLRTPGGHRRFTREGVLGVLAEAEADIRLAEDAARLYERGWSIRQVAERFGWTYGRTRRVLLTRVTLRGKGPGPAAGVERTTPRAYDGDRAVDVVDHAISPIDTMTTQPANH